MRVHVRYGLWKKTSLTRKDEKSLEWVNDIVGFVGEGCSGEETHRTRFRSHYHFSVSICSLTETRNKIAKRRKPRGWRNRSVEHIISFVFCCVSSILLSTACFI